MTAEQVHLIARRGAYPGTGSAAQVVETHISWVLLGDEYAFKIKKPVRLSFLDFSTPEQRAFYCREEVRLNRRLAPDMYLDVLSVQPTSSGGWAIGLTDPERPVIDYAVWMKRMDNSRQMDILLRQGAVGPADMAALAALLAPFHRAHALAAGTFVGPTADDYFADFADLFPWATVAQRLLGDAAPKAFETWRPLVQRFIADYHARLHTREQRGFCVDGHGDLHARNIFLLTQGPVVFDCIEFNPHLRRLDVLNELAFLLMDVEAGGRPSLAEDFLKAYLKLWPCIEEQEDEHLLTYFKAYRANVRLKIALLQWEQEQQEAAAQRARQYWGVLENYMAYLALNVGR